MEANQKVKILLTIDVETYYVNGKLLPFDANIYGKINDKDYGVPKIIELCNKFGIKATFFVDVYEHYKFGLDKLRELCQYISNSGHSVQLHAHTNFIPGYQDKFIKSYDLKTQSNIIAEGKYLLEKWIGRSPIAFRGGAYGVNLNTIKALEENGFLMDSSYFVDNKNCTLSQELKNVHLNKPFMINNIIEIPITVYNLINLYFWSKKSKIDLNACSLSELKNISNKILNFNSNNKMPVLVIFIHSFSFIRWNRFYSNFGVDHKTLRNFNLLFEFLITKFSDKVKFVNFEELNRASIESAVEKDNLKDYVPSANIPNLVSRYFKRLN